MDFKAPTAQKSSKLGNTPLITLNISHSCHWASLWIPITFNFLDSLCSQANFANSSQFSRLILGENNQDSRWKLSLSHCGLRRRGASTHEEWLTFVQLCPSSKSHCICFYIGHISWGELTTCWVNPWERVRHTQRLVKTKRLVETLALLWMYEHHSTTRTHTHTLATCCLFSTVPPQTAAERLFTTTPLVFIWLSCFFCLLFRQTLNALISLDFCFFIFLHLVAD